MKILPKLFTNRNPLLRYVLGALTLTSIGFGVTPAQAITVTPTADLTTIETALFAGLGGITVTGFNISSNSSGDALSIGTYTNASGTYGISKGIVISSGNVANYGDGPNTTNSLSTDFLASQTPDQQALLSPISGLSNHFDVTQIDVIFDADAGFDEVAFNVVFGSEEYPEYVGSQYIDAFGLYLNGKNIAFSKDLPINIDHPDFKPSNAFPGETTELDGVIAPLVNGTDLAPVLTFKEAVQPNSTGNVLTFILADTSDGVYDTTAYISSLSLVGGSPTFPFEPDSVIPNPNDPDGPPIFIFDNVPSGGWFDPPIVNGFTYTMTSPGVYFTDILGFPPGFLDPFTVSVGGNVLGSYNPGDSVNFLSAGFSNVSEFSITGINPLLDPDDPNFTNAFPLQIAFSQPTASFQMTPQTVSEQVPEPSSVVALFGIAGLLLIRWKRP